MDKSDKTQSWRHYSVPNPDAPELMHYLKINPEHTELRTTEDVKPPTEVEEELQNEETPKIIVRKGKKKRKVSMAPHQMGTVPNRIFMESPLTKHQKPHKKTKKATPKRPVTLTKEPSLDFEVKMANVGEVGKDRVFILPSVMRFDRIRKSIQLTKELADQIIPKSQESQTDESVDEETIKSQVEEKKDDQSKKKQHFTKSIEELADTSSKRSSSKRYSFMPTQMDKSIFPRSTVRDDQIASVNFYTGSKYTGQFNKLGMAGKGVYTYPHGVIYDGYFNLEGEFHGEGTLIYPSGARIDGIWKNGKMIEKINFVNGDDTILPDSYCKFPDRRFLIEIENDLKPAGQEYLTQEAEPREIPGNCHDTGIGFYNPAKHVIVDYKKKWKYVTLEDLSTQTRDIMMERKRHLKGKELPKISTEVLMSPDKSFDEKEQWIKSNCRRAEDEVAGYSPELYEKWTPGYKRQDHNRDLPPIKPLLWCNFFPPPEKIDIENLKEKVAFYEYVSVQGPKQTQVSMIEVEENMRRRLTPEELLDGDYNGRPNIFEDVTSGTTKRMSFWKTLGK